MALTFTFIVYFMDKNDGSKCIINATSFSLTHNVIITSSENISATNLISWTSERAGQRKKIFWYDRVGLNLPLYSRNGMDETTGFLELPLISPN